MAPQERSDRADRLLTVADIAGHVGAQAQTGRGWIHRGELKASKFGTRIGWRVRRADQDELRRRQLAGAITRHLFALRQRAGTCCVRGARRPPWRGPRTRTGPVRNVFRLRCCRDVCLGPA